MRDDCSATDPSPGLVHADGHAGNVLVRQHPNGKKGKHQIVIIDHGLVVRLTDGAWRRRLHIAPLAHAFCRLPQAVRPAVER
jgi:predicted unusual protein kinase regulating ubiquinone biosynthesis (AarF/ABC1/UbiB family)